MSQHINININGCSVQVVDGTTVAVAVFMSGETAFRTSLSGEPRAPLCGMGSCFECRVSIDGQMHRRSCQTQCEEGMEVETL